MTTTATAKNCHNNQIVLICVTVSRVPDIFSTLRERPFGKSNRCHYDQMPLYWVILTLCFCLYRYCTTDSYCIFIPTSNLRTHLHICDDLLEEAAEGRALLVHGRQVHRAHGESHDEAGRSLLSNWRTLYEHLSTLSLIWVVLSNTTRRRYSLIF